MVYGSEEHNTTDRSMKAFRLLGLLKKVNPSSLQRIVPFSSLSAAIPRSSNFFSDNAVEGGSAVYRHALKFQRPTVIEWSQQLVNSVSFIGSVDLPLKIVDSRKGRFGVHTLLRVKTSRESDSTFRILLLMSGEIAAISFKHLKPNDFIYVSGSLGCYTKALADGRVRTFFKVTVKELNYVAQHGQGSSCRKFEESRSGEGGDGLEKYKDRLHLWQVFFANPYEWWDNRKGKGNLRQPDFKHKDTGEALWLSLHDPPWIKRQLQLLDSKMVEQGLGERVASRSRVSTWVYDD